MVVLLVVAMLWALQEVEQMGERGRKAVLKRAVTWATWGQYRLVETQAHRWLVVRDVGPGEIALVEDFGRHENVARLWFMQNLSRRW